MRSFLILLILLQGAAASAQSAGGPDDLHGPAWSGAVEPFRVIGNIYYVGATNIAAYLITTEEGHILLDSGTREMAPIVLGSIEKLGFKPKDVKIMLSGHAHFDHVGAHAALQRATGATVMALADDAPAIAAGKDLSPLGAEGWEPVKVDRILKDGAIVRLGSTRMRAVQAPGHTPGCTVWTTTVPDTLAGKARPYSVAFYACAGPNLSVQLRDNPAFPKLVAETRGAFARLMKLKPDIYLTMHPKEQFAGKVEAIKAGTRPHPLHDPAAWRAMLQKGRAGFEARVNAERAAATKRAP